MSKNKRKFGLKEKLQVLRAGKKHGVGLTCRTTLYHRVSLQIKFFKEER